MELHDFFFLFQSSGNVCCDVDGVRAVRSEVVHGYQAGLATMATNTSQTTTDQCEWTSKNNRGRCNFNRFFSRTCSLRELIVCFLFRPQVSKLKTENFKPKEQVTLEPYERDHAVVIALYRPPTKKSKDT